MNPWIPLDANDLDEKHKGTRGGVVFNYSLSPYDIPEAVRGNYCPDSKKFIIDFKFITEETLVERALTEHANAKVGVNSGRIYSISLDITAKGVQAANAQIESTLNEAVVSLARDEALKMGINDQMLRSLKPRMIPHLTAVDISKLAC